MSQVLANFLMPKQSEPIKETIYSSRKDKTNKTQIVSEKKEFREAIEDITFNKDQETKRLNNKVNKIKDNSKKTYENSGLKASLIDEEQIETADRFEVDESILMALLTKQLSLNEETITQTLINQGITLEDLVNADNLRSFVMEALGEDEISFLNGTRDIKIISELWDQIQVLYATQYSDNKVVTEEIHMNQEGIVQDTLISTDLLKTQEKVQQITQMTLNYKEEVDSNHLKDNLQELSYNFNDSSKQTETKIIDISTTLPLQEITREIKVKYWQGNLIGNTLDHTLSAEDRVHIQLLEKMHYTHLESSKELEMQLTPKELGKLTMKMIEQNGTLTAQIKVEQDKTKQLILENINSLKEGLEKQGLVIEDVQVEVRKDSHQTQMEMEKQKSTKRIQEIINKHMSYTLEEEPIHNKKSLTSLELDYEV